MEVAVLSLPSPKLSSAIPKAHVWVWIPPPCPASLRNKISRDFQRKKAEIKPVHAAPRSAL